MSKFLNLLVSLVLASLSVAACAAWLHLWCPAVADMESNILQVFIPAISSLLTLGVLTVVFADLRFLDKMKTLLLQIAGTIYFGGLLWVIFVWNTGVFADTEPYKMLASFGFVTGVIFAIPVMAAVTGMDIEK